MSRSALKMRLRARPRRNIQSCSDSTQSFLWEAALPDGGPTPSFDKSLCCMTFLSASSAERITGNLSQRYQGYPAAWGKPWMCHLDACFAVGLMHSSTVGAGDLADVSISPKSKAKGPLTMPRQTSSE